MRISTLSFLAWCLLMPMAYAQDASSTSSAATGSGETVDVWQLRQERAASFGTQWDAFAIVHLSWVTKWQKAHGKLTAHTDRCHEDVRSANRDTLLPVTEQCYRGQLQLERDALTNERGIIDQWPGIPAASKAAMLGSIDALLGAMQPVVDAIDAKVFTSLDPFRDVRANLRTQYRQPYWLASAHFRADASLTWIDHLLLSLHTLTEKSAFHSSVQEKLLSAQHCYEAAEPPFIAARDAETLEESRMQFTQGAAALAPCPALLTEAQTFLQQSSVSSFSLTP